MQRVAGTGEYFSTNIIKENKQCKYVKAIFVCITYEIAQAYLRVEVFWAECVCTSCYQLTQSEL
jgi:hypothetical protein